MRVKLEVDTVPPLGFSMESKILKDPIPVVVIIAVPFDLFAGKMHALLFRLWKELIKGRD